MKKFHSLTGLLVVCLLAALPVAGQVETARITGTVTDSTGARVPGSEVTFTHVTTNTVARTQTQADGRYVSPPLRIGEYRVEITAEGFKRAVRTGVVLLINQTALLDIPLELGAVSETVDVTADAPLLETTQATQGQVIDNKRMVDMPLNGRDYIQLALLSAGAVQPIGGRFGGFIAGGQRTTQNNYILDGVDNNNVQIAAQGRQAESVKPAVDAIQEFRIATNSFSAEYGRAAGGVVNVSLKSGSNDLHGTAYEFMRNEAMDAKNLFDPADRPKPPFKRNQFGFSAGGPIVRNKLFVFGDYEWTRIRESRTVTSTVPTEAIRSGDFSAAGTQIFDPFSYNGTTRTPFPGSVIPASSINPISRTVAGLYPLPQINRGVNNFVFNPPRRSDVDKWDIRTDYNAGASDNIYFRFSYQRTFDPASPRLPGQAYDDSANGSDFEHNGRNMALVWNHVWNPALITSTRLGYNKLFTERIFPIEENLNASLGIRGVNQALPGMGTMNITGYTNIGTGSFTPNLADSQTRQLVTDTTWNRASHSVKFGVNFNWLQSYLTNPQQELGVFFFNGNYTRNPQGNRGGDPFADFLTGVMFQGDVSTSAYMNLRAPFWQGYIQDEWRASRKLTLNFGLRYELNRNWVETRDGISQIDISDPANPFWILPQRGGSRADRALIQDDKNLLVPRFGFAYHVAGGTVLRGGYGMFVAQYEGTGGGQFLEGNPPFLLRVRASTDSRNVTLNLADGIPGDILTPRRATSLSFSTFERTPKMPVSQQWNFNIQQQLGSDWVWEIGYYGTKGNHLVNRWDSNYALPGAGNINNRRLVRRAPWPNEDFTVGPLSSFNAHQFNGNSLFHSLQTKLEKRFSNGFTLLTSFIWSKTIGDVQGFSGSGNTANSAGQDPLNWRANRSLDNQHMGRRFVVSYIYEMPFGRGQNWGAGWNGPVNAIAGGWALSGITTLTDGQPMGLSVTGNPSNTGTASRGDRPDVVGAWQLSRDERSLGRFFNTAAFVPNQPFTYGNAGRNILFTPGNVNFDLAAYKRFVLTERIQAQFRVEAFNAFNTPPIGSPNVQVGNRAFGTITSAGRPRNLQLGLKLVW
ncbi:MAG: carboxypeptidase regulatory-like domain-containing protein [Bryobacteraceae bacterium]